MGPQVGWDDRENYSMCDQGNAYLGVGYQVMPILAPPPEMSGRVLASALARLSAKASRQV